MMPALFLSYGAGKAFDPARMRLVGDNVVFW